MLGQKQWRWVYYGFLQVRCHLNNDIWAKDEEVREWGIQITTGKYSRYNEQMPQRLWRVLLLSTKAVSGRGQWQETGQAQDRNPEQELLGGQMRCRAFPLLKWGLLDSEVRAVGPHWSLGSVWLQGHVGRSRKYSLETCAGVQVACIKGAEM